MNAEVIERQYRGKEPAPKCCYYCDEEKDFLMVKPSHMAFKGQITLSVAMDGKQHWMCLECFSSELDSMGHSVDIYEYE